MRSFGKPVQAKTSTTPISGTDRQNAEIRALIALARGKRYLFAARGPLPEPPRVITTKNARCKEL